MPKLDVPCIDLVLSRTILGNTHLLAAAGLEFRSVEPGDHAGGDARADEMPDIAAQGADLLYEARRDELVAIRGHQEHGLDVRVEPGVHAGHLELVFEIADRPQAADDDAGADRLREMHQ